jgi:hypothetical protein
MDQLVVTRTQVGCPGIFGEGASSGRATERAGRSAMADLKAKHFDEIPYYQGTNAIPGIKFHSAGRELGVTACGACPIR